MDINGDLLDGRCYDLSCSIGYDLNLQVAKFGPNSLLEFHFNGVAEMCATKN